MARLDKISNPSVIPFPHTMYGVFEKFFGKSIEIPEKFQPALNLKATPRV